jgi:hypothetical protein
MIEIQRLISFLYPNYYNQTNNASTISGGPLLKLKFSNFASTPTGEGLVGYLDGFTFDPDMESGYVSTIKDGMITTVINASVNFTVLHTHKLGWTGAKRRVRNFPYGISSPVDDNQDRQAQEAQDLAALNADVAALKATMEAGLQSARELSAAFKETEEAWKIAELTELANASNAAGQRQLTLDEKARIRSIASGNSYEHEYILAEHEQRMGEVDELLALAESETEDREANGELSNVRPTKKTPKWGPRKNGKTTPKGGGGNPPLSRGVKQTLEGLYAADDLRKIEAQKKKDQETDALISAAGDKCKYYKIMCDRY